MKAWEVGDQKGLGSLRMVERDPPIAGHGQAVVAIKACALNHRDLMVMRGGYGGPKPETRIPLGDGAGEVIAIGEGVTNVSLGDNVCATHFTGWIDGAFKPSYFGHDLGSTADGTLAEQIVVPAACLVKTPMNFTPEESSTLPITGATVWACVQALGQVKAGDTVLTLGTGGVSVFALQFAKMNGARAVITSSSDEKLERMKALGADVTVNYRDNPDWEKEVLEQTGGVDIVVETVGTSTLGKSMAACAPNGRIGLIGALGGQGQPNMGGLLLKNLVLKGITSGSKTMLEECVAAIEVNGIDPVIDKVFSFEDAPEAYEYLDSAAHIGKVVIKL
ncbi:MAG: zinc-dependent alcohol dehydrogenase family protein [Rhodospirillaceae bacterium]